MHTGTVRTEYPGTRMRPGPCARGGATRPGTGSSAAGASSHVSNLVRVKPVATPTSSSTPAMPIDTSSQSGRVCRLILVLAVERRFGQDLQTSSSRARRDLPGY
eukprot:3527555-Rhodomonas_salina.1